MSMDFNFTTILKWAKTLSKNSCHSRVGTGAPCLAPILGTGSARLSGITNQVTCGTYTGTVAQCSTVEIKCAATTTTAPTCLTVQLWTNGASNVHLMFEDITPSFAATATGRLQALCFHAQNIFPISA